MIEAILKLIIWFFVMTCGLFGLSYSLKNDVSGTIYWTTCMALGVCIFFWGF